MTEFGLPPPPAPPMPPMRLKDWEEVFAWVGIIAGFLVLLTIPGWLGLRAWGRYQRGEQSSIKAYLVFGIIVTCLAATAIIGGSIATLTA